MGTSSSSLLAIKLNTEQICRQASNGKNIRERTNEHPITFAIEFRVEYIALENFQGLFATPYMNTKYNNL